MIRRVALPILLGAAALAPGVPAADGSKAKVNGYLEWRQGKVLIVEGQRVRLAPDGRFKGKGEAGSLQAIPLGYIVEAAGVRQPDGSILAARVVAKPNGEQLFEQDVMQATDQLETAFRKAGELLMAAGDSSSSLGKLQSSGPQVVRVRGIVDRLLPPYLAPEDVRVYVVDNEEWNAMAMGNYSIYVFSGLMEAADDDELAIVLGHELAHASHEHTRRQHKRLMLIQVGAAVAEVAISELDDGEQSAAALVVGLGATAFANGYSRDMEDQADRVGMRYAYEGGFDVSKGPALWQRFAERYGDQDKVTNIFFGDHSRSSVRARELEREIGYNYGTGRKRSKD